MVTIKHKVTLKTKTSQEENPESVDFKKVTLKQKQPETSVAAEQEAKNPETDTRFSPQKSAKNSNTGKIIGGIVAAAAIIVGIYFFGIKGIDNSGEDEGGTSTEIVAQNSGNTADESASNSAVTGNNVPEEASTENASEGATTAESSVNVENAQDTPSANEGVSSSVQTESKKAEDSSVAAPTISNAPSISSSAPISGDVEENARRVIRGDFGNGQARKDKLGASYSEIQGKVNEMYRQGLVK